MKILFLVFTFLAGSDFFYSFSSLPDKAPAFESDALSSSELKEPILKQLGLTEKELKEEFWAEKALPYAPAQTVVVVPKLIGEDEGMFTLNAIVVVVNSQTGKIIQQFQEENTVFSDAVYISGFTIDTAPYMLTKEIRAFGIRAKYYGSSNPNPYSEVQLSLFIQEGAILRRILKDYVVESSAGEWNMECDGRFEDLKAILSFETEKTKGYFNLVIKERSSVRTTERIKGECEEKIVKNPEKKRVLHYNGKSYQ